MYIISTIVQPFFLLCNTCEYMTHMNLCVATLNMLLFYTTSS